MDFGQLMEAAGLTEAEQKELKDYIHDEGLADLMFQVAEQIQIVPHSERALFDALPFSYNNMDEEEVDQETDELNQLFQKSILNAHQIQLSSYVEQICNNMLLIQDLEPQPLEQGQTDVIQQDFNSQILEYDQISKTITQNYETFINEYSNNKSLLNIFQPNLIDVLENQQNVYKVLIKNLETAMDSDLKKNNGILKEANRLSQQIQNIRIKNFLLNQLNMKESYLKYNKLDKTSIIQREFGDTGSSVNMANLYKMLRSLQEENVRLNALFIQTQKNVLPNSVYQAQKQILYQFSADQQYHLSQFKLAHNFIKDGQMQLNTIINSNNGILELISEMVNDAQGTLSWVKDQQHILQDLITQLRENKEKLSAVSQTPITYLGIDKVLEPLLQQRLETPGQALGAYETKLNEEIIDKMQYDAENMTKRQVFRKRRIIECLQSLRQENAKMFGIIGQINQTLNIYGKE